MLVFGEDVGAKGGVYGVTRGLQRRAGAARVFDTLLDEQSILGLALGAGLSGLVPIPEIQYLAYLHNAEDQLRGEAATLRFFSNGQYENPLVVRVAGYGYQKGFGGHFHNDNAVAVLRDIPGLVIASPARPADAAAMLRTCVAAAVTDGTVSVYLEPIALYHTRDLHEPGDEGWLAPYDPPARWADRHVPIGAPAVAREGDDVLVVTWGNGLYLSLRVAARLAAGGISCRVLDLRWLAPLAGGGGRRARARAIGRVVVVDETRRSGGVGEAVVAGLVEEGYRGPLVRVAAARHFRPARGCGAPRPRERGRHRGGDPFCRLRSARIGPIPNDSSAASSSVGASPRYAAIPSAASDSGEQLVRQAGASARTPRHAGVRGPRGAGAWWPAPPPGRPSGRRRTARRPWRRHHP